MSKKEAEAQDAMLHVDEILHEDNLQLARDLVVELESGNAEDASRLLNELVSVRTSELYQDVGKLARNLHDSINDMPGIENLDSIDSSEFPDAKERLEYVITLTEESANKTLEAVEDTLPIIQNTSDRAQQLLERWGRFKNREMDLDDFKELSGDIESFLQHACYSTDEMSGKLTEVLVAQSFQDLTGQMIRRVIELVDNVEQNLVSIVVATGTTDQRAGVDAPVEKDTKTASGVEAEGPQLPSKTEGVIKGQGEVDDLLASLGF